MRRVSNSLSPSLVFTRLIDTKSILEDTTRTVLVCADNVTMALLTTRVEGFL